jgi:hypothetical protein
MMLLTTRYTFLNPLNDSKHAAPNGAFALLANDSYRPIAPTELQRARRAIRGLCGTLNR